MMRQNPTTPPQGGRWFLLDVMKRGAWPPRPGRTPNIWSALLIDIDPDIPCEGTAASAARHCWLDLGRHKDRDLAWEYAEALLATRH